MTASRNNTQDMVRQVRDLIRAVRADLHDLPLWVGPWLYTLDSRPDVLGFTQHELDTLKRLHIGGED